MQLWLVPSAAGDPRVPPPYACPHTGCDGRRFRRLQAVAKPVRDARAPAACGGSTVGGVIAMRYACRACGRSFRVYPRGVDRGNVAVGIKRFAAALRFLGLSYRDVSLALTVLGVPISSSRVHAVVAPQMRGLARRSTAPLLARVDVDGRAGHAAGVDADGYFAATIEAGGRRLTLRRAVDARGRTALVIEGIDRNTRRAVEAWVRGVLVGFGVSVDVVFPAVRRAGSRPAPAAVAAAGGIDRGEPRDVDDDDGGAVGGAVEGAVGAGVGGDIGDAGCRSGDAHGRGVRGDGGIGGVDGGRVVTSASVSGRPLVGGFRAMPRTRSTGWRHRRRHRRDKACGALTCRRASGTHGARGGGYHVASACAPASGARTAAGHG